MRKLSQVLLEHALCAQLVQYWNNLPEHGDMGCQALPRYTTPLSWWPCGSLSMQL